MLEVNILEAEPILPEVGEYVTLTSDVIQGDPGDSDYKPALDELKTQVNNLKEDLADKLPKSPANWEHWTAEEQATAQERIGILSVEEVLF